jgi:hypothetical protein
LITFEFLIRSVMSVSWSCDEAGDDRVVQCDQIRRRPGGDRLDHLGGELRVGHQSRLDPVLLLRFVEGLDSVMDHVGLGIVGMPERDYLLRHRIRGQQARRRGYYCKQFA